LVYGRSTVVLIGFTCPAITVGTVILRALDRVRERALGCSVYRFIGVWQQESGKGPRLASLDRPKVVVMGKRDSWVNKKKGKTKECVPGCL